MAELRDYQKRALENIHDDYTSGYRSLVVSAATGTGKTQIFSRLPEFMKDVLSGRTLVLAHRTELIDQAIEKLKSANPNLKVGKEMASDKADKDSDIIVASVQTLGRKGSKRSENIDWTEFDKIIVDECHHSTAQSYLNIMELAGVLSPDSKKLLIGFTATPQRSDGKALAAIYKKISYVYGLRPAIKDGWLCDIKAFRVDTRTDISNIGTSGGDFKIEELADKINNPERNLKIVEAWKKVAEGRQTVVFCANIAHSKAVAEEFSSEGIPTEAIWGNDPERAVKLQKYALGEIKVLTNCEVLTEGWDSPQTSCIVLARPTKSPVLFTQMCGRGTRLADNKTDCLIVDVMDVSGEHSLCTVPTLMGLDSGLDLCGRSLIKSVEEIESAQEANPNIDFMKMKKITDLKSYIESINLFEVRFPKEAEEHSDFKWCQAATGGFRLSVPKGRNGEPAGFVHIQQNMLDKWDIKGNIRGTDVVGQRNTMEEAFAAADNAIRTRAEGSVHLVDRKSSWNNDPASVNQFKLLTKLYGTWKKWPDNLTKGQAAHFIDLKIAKRGVK